MSFEFLPPLSSSPSSEAPTSPPFSDNISQVEFNSPESSQSSRVVTVNDDDSDRTQTSLVISKIEEIFANMIDVLAQGGDALVIPYRRRLPRDEGVLRFPGTSQQEAIKFSQFLLGHPLNEAILTVPLL